MTLFKEALNFDDVLVIPKYSKITSRKEVDLTSEVVKGISLSFPVMSASMDTVTEYEMAVAMDHFGGVGVIHRYLTLEQQLEQLDKFFQFSPNGKVGMAIGVVDDFYERAIELSNKGVSFLSIDVAHGDHELVIKALNKIKGSNEVSVPILVGNVATKRGALRLIGYGADGVKVGIGPGFACTTRYEAGVGYPQFSAIMEAAEETDIPICADGGITNSGDIVKALGAGASSVMIGRLLAGTLETPTQLVHEEGGEYKLYRGMASETSKLENGMPARNIEGISTKVPYKGPVRHILESIEDGIKSGFSYTGSLDITEFWGNVDFVKVSKIK